jgi:gentisate 1,2-dioxygenase
MATSEQAHYHVQKERRADFLSEWRKRRRTGVLKGSELRFREREPGVRLARFAGADEGAPTRTLDAGAHELDPGATTTPHRHSWDAVLFVQEGAGWSEIGGERIDWKPWDAIHIPAWTWHRHGNDGPKTARYLSFSSEPLLSTLNLATIEEGLPSDPAERLGSAEPRGGDDAHSRRLTRLSRAQEQNRSARIHMPYDDVVLRDTPRGSRTAFLADESIGFRTSGITFAMFQIPPGKAQTMHRHPGEAFLYVVEGSGRSYIGVEPDGGPEYAWEPGDLINVDHFVWHQHINDSSDTAARVVRVHMFASILETMRALADPVDLFNERPEDLAKAFDITDYVWPPDRRPA